MVPGPERLEDQDLTYISYATNYSYNAYMNI